MWELLRVPSGNNNKGETDESRWFHFKRAIAQVKINRFLTFTTDTVRIPGVPTLPPGESVGIYTALL